MHPNLKKKKKKKKKNWINRSTVKEMWGNVFKRLHLRESKQWKNYPRNWPYYELDSVNKLWRFIPKFFDSKINISTKGARKFMTTIHSETKKCNGMESMST